MKTDIIPFGEWLPDVPEHENPGCVTAYNVTVRAGKYIPIKEPVADTAAFSEDFISAFSVRDEDGNVHSFGATRTGIYLYNSTTDAWDNVSLSGGYTTPSGDNWEWEVFGSTVIATNYHDYPQKYIIGTDVLFSNLTTDFKARYVSQDSNHLIFGYILDDTDGARGNRLKWSGLNNLTDWDSANNNGADFQDVAEIVFIQGITRMRDMVVVFGQNDIFRMDYIGSPVTFSIRPSVRDKGLAKRGGAVSDGKLVYFVSKDGFFAYDGSGIQPIGHGKVDDYFLNLVDISYGGELFSIADVREKNIMWSYRTVDATSENNDRQLIYNTAENRFTEGRLSIKYPVRVHSPGYTLDQLDQFGTLDELQYPIDSDFYKGGALNIGYVTYDNAIAYSTGDNMPVRLETGERQINPNGIALHEAAQIITDGTVSASLGLRGDLTGAVAYTAYNTVQEDGFIYFDTEGRYSTLRADVTGSATYISGFRIAYQPAGEY